MVAGRLLQMREAVLGSPLQTVQHFGSAICGCCEIPDHDRLIERPCADLGATASVAVAREHATIALLDTVKSHRLC